MQSERENEFFIDNLLVRIHFIIVMIRWTGLAPWEFEFPFPGSLISTFINLPRETLVQTAGFSSVGSGCNHVGGDGHGCDVETPDFYHKTPDPGDLQYKSRGLKMAIFSRWGRLSWLRWRGPPASGGRDSGRSRRLRAGLASRLAPAAPLRSVI